MPESDHQIARFKAKYGVSNRDVAIILKISPTEVRKCAETDTFSDEYNELMRKVELVIERTITEANLLQDHAPMIEAVRHENERLKVANDQLKLELDQEKSGNHWLAEGLRFFKEMPALKRIIFLFNPSSFKWKVLAK